jgi:hypothetical protein
MELERTIDESRDGESAAEIDAELAISMELESLIELSKIDEGSGDGYSCTELDPMPLIAEDMAEGMTTFDEVELGNVDLGLVLVFVLDARFEELTALELQFPNLF